MNEKMILISIDGMRPDGFTACGHPFSRELTEISSYTRPLRPPSGNPSLPYLHVLRYPTAAPRNPFQRVYSTCTAGQGNCRAAEQGRKKMRRLLQLGTHPSYLAVGNHEIYCLF